MKIFISLLFCFLILFAKSNDTQPNPKTIKWENEKNIVSISIGLPLFTEAWILKNALTFSINYQYRFMKSFAIEPFYSYAQNNSFPNFFNDNVKLNQYIKSMEVPSFEHARWDKVNVHSFGARLHFAYINNPRWYFTFNFATGYFVSESSLHFLKNFDWRGNPIELIDYNTEFHEKWNRGLFIMPGILLNRNLSNRFSLGFYLGGYFAIGQNSFLRYEDLPIMPNHWNASLTIGMSIN